MLIQYLHCRRPGEVKGLKVTDIDFDWRKVTYNIKKQKYKEDNRRQVRLVSDREVAYLEDVIEGISGYLFPRAYTDLEVVREPFRETRDEFGVAELPLENLWHTRISS